jgi:general secretion pathway protein G
MTRRTHDPRRAGFTLVELMVVIGIIATLIALLLPAINGARENAKRAVAATEMAQLGSAIQAFKYEKKIAPPSTIILREDGVYTTGAEVQSFALLKQIWPQLNGPVDWNGDGTITPNVPLTLEGDQCLVFFLGGIPQNGIPTGFSTNPSNPAAHIFPAPGGGNTKTYFEFPADRMQSGTNTSFANQNNAAKAGFPSFIDQWKVMPYAYFAAGNGNGTKNAYNVGDCTTIGAHPYKDGSGQFFQPTGWQIVSAGRDKSFGATVQLTKGGVPQTDPDGDNVASFFGGALSGY